jgi:hypothetical protein
MLALLDSGRSLMLDYRLSRLVRERESQRIRDFLTFIS